MVGRRKQISLFQVSKGVKGISPINISDSGERKKKTSFAQLDDDLVRNFREYSIPTIDIDLDNEDASLDEVIQLFIDINQYGVKVTRFDIVRTMYEQNRLLSDAFKLVAIRQKRRKDWFYKLVDNDFTFVLKKLQNVQSVTDFQQRVDRVWERLLEIVLFIRTGKHRTLAQTLKSFLGDKIDSSRITSNEKARLRQLFSFLKTVYSNPSFKISKLATDQPHFYTMITSIHSLNLLEQYGAGPLKQKLTALAAAIEKKTPPAGKSAALKEYLDLSAKQTTHPGRRSTRQDRFAELLEAV